MMAKMSKTIQKIRIKSKKRKKKSLNKVGQTKQKPKQKSPPKDKKRRKKRREERKKKDHFVDAVTEIKTGEETEPVVFVGSAFQVPFKDHFFQKFYDLDLWILLIGSFCSALMIAYNWFMTSVVMFLMFLSVYFQLLKRQRLQAIEYCSQMLSRDPDRLRNFLATISAPKNLNVGRTGDAPCEWINDILNKFWPNINSIAQEQIDKRGFSKQGLDVGNGHVIYFERFTLGDKPPALTSIHIRQTGHRKDEIVIILKLIYFGNCLILFSYKTKLFFKAKAGVKDVYFRGNAIVVLRPLLEFPPFIGGVSICLQDIPLIDYSGINLANIADNRLFKNFVINQLKRHLVAPNKIYVTLFDDRNVVRELKFPLPIGMVFVEIIEAEDLPAMDSNRCLVFTGSSDSFCVIKVGDFEFRTDIIYSSLDPYYGESFAAPIHDFNDYIKIEIFDKDAITSSDFMGSLEFKMKDLGDNKNLNGKDKWLPIGKCKSGWLHFRIAIFELSGNQRNIEKIELARQHSSVNFPIGILSIYIYYVSSISTIDEDFDFKPAVKLMYSDDNQFYQTKHLESPKRGFYHCNEKTQFMVKDIQKDFVNISVVCQEIKTLNISKVFGECSISVKELLNETDMVLNREFPIRKTSDLANLKSGIIRMFLSLQVCKYRVNLMDNLKVPSNIQANIAKVTEYRNSLSKLYREPMYSLKNPIRSLKIIVNRISPFAAQPKTIVAEDIAPIPMKTLQGCWVKIRIKWPDRTALHIEVLKLIRIPLEIVSQNNKYAICVVLSLIESQKLGFAQQIQKELGRVGETVRHGIGFKGKTEDKKKDKDGDDVRRLQRKYTNKFAVTNYVTDIDYNERLIFRISSGNNIDSHVIRFYLVLYQPQKYFATVFDSRLAAFSALVPMPKVDFKGDSLEDWYRLELFDAFKRIK